MAWSEPTQSRHVVTGTARNQTDHEAHFSGIKEAMPASGARHRQCWDEAEAARGSIPETECQKSWTRKTQIHLMEPRKQKREDW